MFQVTCTSCNTLVDTAGFRDGRIDACPHCGIPAFDTAKNVSPPPILGKSQPDTSMQASFRIACSHCGSSLKATEKMIGKTYPCPKCKEPVRIFKPQEDTVQEETIVATFDDIDFGIPEAEKKDIPLPPEIPATQATTESSTPAASSEKIVISFGDEPASVPVPLEPPKQNAVQVPTTPSGKLPPRLRRLYADAEAVTAALNKSPHIRLQKFEGTPPDVYLVEYSVRGVESVQGSKINYRDHHVLEIRLTSEYPRSQPKCRLLTPIFHPNFEPAVICIGDHWTAQERLIDLIVRIGEMITYQSYNIKSPLDGEAAMWADLNQKMLPIDNRDLIPPD